MSETKSGGFPELSHNHEFQATRPMALQELPRQMRIDQSMDVIRSHHERIAKSIAMFWGHKDCVEYIEQLMMNGGDGDGKARVGFKHDVIAAFLNLIELHDVKQTDQVNKKILDEDDWNKGSLR
jgi:hypothetical protein